MQAEATVDNPQHLLLPGMFARVAVLAGAEQHYLTLPQTAITYNPYGATVFLTVKDASGKLTAQQTFVTTGATRGDQVAILSGLKEGDNVVTSGQLKLKNGYAARHQQQRPSPPTPRTPRRRNIEGPQ